MNSAEPSFFRWVKSDLSRFALLFGGLPILLSFLRTVSFQWEVFSYSPLVWMLSLLGLLPDLLVLSLFLKYVNLKDEPAAPLASTARLSEEISSGTGANTPRAFFWAAVKTWALCFGTWWFFSFRFYGFNSFTLDVSQFGVSVACYCFALKELRIVQQRDSHDAASRLLGAAAFYFIGLNLVGGLYTKLFYGFFSFNLWLALAALGLVAAGLYYEQRRYLLAQATFLNKNPLYQIESIDPLHPVEGLLPLAYWPELALNGILHRVEQSGAKDEPFRSSQVKVPLCLVPTQVEPFMSFLSQRLYWLVGLFLVSLVLVFMSFSAQS